MSIANKALAVLAALAFFLPFVALSVSVSNPVLGNAKLGFSVSMTGEKIVQCYLSPCTAKDIMGSQPGILGAMASRMPDSGVNETIKLNGPDVPDLGINFLLFAAIAVVVAAIVLFFARPGEVLSGVVSVAAIVLLFLFRSKIGDAISPFLNSPELKAASGLGQIQFQFGMGFWACAILSGLSAILAFKGNLSQQSAVATGMPGSTPGFAPPLQPGATPPAQEQLAVCSSCGSVNSAGSKFCLSCGAAMIPAAAQPVATKAAEPQDPVCPACGAGNAGTGKFCLACGASLAAPASPPVEKKAAEPQGPVCPSCGASNAGTGKFCLACGASLAAPAAPPVEKKAAEPQGPVCPSCGASNAGTGKFCLACGEPLTTPAAQPTETKVPEPQAPVCPSCGSSSTGTGKFCLACGAPLTAPVAQPAETKAPEPQAPVCPSCGSSRAGTGKFCLACGASLMANVQLFQPAETSAAAPPAAPVAAAAAASAPSATVSTPSGAAAAQASVAAPAGQPLRATAPAPEPPVEPVAASAAPVIAAAAVPVAEQPATPLSQAAPSPSVPEQPSLDWTAAPPPPEPKQPACSACGAALNEGQKFCLACGTPVGQASAPPQTEAPPTFTPAPQPEQIQPQAPTQIFQPAAPPSSAKVWIVTIVLLGALGTGGWFAWKYFTTPNVDVTARVRSIHVASGSTSKIDVTVSGSTDIDWSIQEGDKGGQIAGLGAVMDSGQPYMRANYTAPQTPGTFHVIAACHANPKHTAQIEVTVLGSASPEIPATTSEQPAPPSAATATTSTAPTPAPAYPNAAQIVGTWSGPTADMRTTIGADSIISMTSAANPQKNVSGTYHFTDNTHLDVDFGNGDARKWEILGIQGAYLRVSEQSKTGSSAIIFQKVQ